MCRLIDWMNQATCEKDSTMIRVYDKDPQEEIDLLREAINRLRG